MKIITILFLLLLTTATASAQDTFTDPNSGFSLEYTDAWKVFIEGEITGFSQNDGMVNFQSSYDEDPVSPEDFIAVMKDDKVLVEHTLSDAFGSKMEILTYGIDTIGGTGAYYVTANKQEKFETDEVYNMKVKLIVVSRNNYTCRITIVALQEDYAGFIPKADELLSGVYFKE